MKPDIHFVLQVFLFVALLSTPALGADETPISESNAEIGGGEAATVGADGQHGGDMKPVKHGYTWGIKGGAGHTIGKSYGWPYKGGHGWGWGCKLGCCFKFAGKCKHCCRSVQEAQAYNQKFGSKP